MIEIPKGCGGCTNLDALLAIPVATLEDRIEQATGSKVRSKEYSLGGFHSWEGGNPAVVRLVNGQFASRFVVDTAYYGLKGDTRTKEENIQSLVSGCPGRVSAEGVVDSQQ